MNPLAFVCETGNDHQAALFVTRCLDPLFGPARAVDSRRVEDTWVHLLHHADPDTNNLRAHLVAARLQRDQAAKAGRP